MKFQTARTARTVAAPASSRASGPLFRELTASAAATSAMIAATRTRSSKSVESHAPNGRPRIVMTMAAIEPPTTSCAIRSRPFHAAVMAAVPVGAAGLGPGSSIIVALPRCAGRWVARRRRARYLARSPVGRCRDGLADGRARPRCRRGVAFRGREAARVGRRPAGPPARARRSGSGRHRRRSSSSSAATRPRSRMPSPGGPSGAS